MFVDSSKTTISGKTYRRHLLRDSYREGGRIKHHTIANISKCSPEEIEAIRLALRFKGDLARMLEARPLLQTRQGLSVGAVWTVYAMARELGIEAALGPSREGRLALWQVVGRALDQGSRLSAVRLAGSHCACEVLGLEAGFDEDDLYGNLDWLADQQTGIERRLFRANRKTIDEGGLFLYDVTSSYLEGTDNELSAFGYNRDGKRGKKQIVIGLLTTAEGEPVSVEVFEGNTTDPKTFAPQIRKAVERFGAKAVTFVGDRGMIKSEQIEALGQEGFHYITAITKPQIEVLLRQGTIQMEMFDAEVAEVTSDGGVRYVLRRNPARAAEMAACRRDKLAALGRTVEGRNAYLREHARAHVDVALRVARERAAQLNMTAWVHLTGEGRRIILEVDEGARAEEAKLDGCYVIKTDLRTQAADKQTVHDRYKDLAQVERVFRTSKTVELEVRPIYVRLASRTRGHVLVVMLAYRIVRELARRWRDLDTTVQEGLNQLAHLCVTEILDHGRPLCCQVPQPRPAVRTLLEAARIALPPALPSKGVNVSTKRKLPERRKNR